MQQKWLLKIQLTSANSWTITWPILLPSWNPYMETGATPTVTSDSTKEMELLRTEADKRKQVGIPTKARAGFSQKGWFL